MVDSEACYNNDETHLKPELGLLSDCMPQAVSQCLCAVCVKFNTGVDMRKTSKFSEYDDILVERTHELTAHQYLLCSESVCAYLIETRSWRKWSNTKIASCLRR